MDQPHVPEAEHRRALVALQRFNRLSRSDAILWPSIRQLALALAPHRVRILDVASGGGDVPLRISRRAARHKLAVEIVGCDRSAVAVQHASERARAARHHHVSFVERDVLDKEVLPACDIAMCSLFLHHLDEPEAVLVLRRMAAAARHMVLVNDLRRTRFGYALAQVAGRLLTRSPIVRYDGPVSVAAAFRCDEAVALAERAGLRGATIRHCWPQRFLLQWRRP